MKKHPIKEVEFIYRDKSSRVFRLPKDKATGLLSLISDFEVTLDEQLISSEEVFKGLIDKYGRSGSVIRGCRSRDDLSQFELAKKLGIPQSDVSQMENGKRPIGKKMAIRLAKIFKTNYRVFL